jgi:hypothetical protein
MWPGSVLGAAWSGQSGLDGEAGAVTADDLSTEGFGPLCWVLRNPDVAGWRGVGMARLGRVLVSAGVAGNRCRRQHWGLRLPLLLSLESR